MRARSAEPGSITLGHPAISKYTIELEAKSGQQGGFSLRCCPAPVGRRAGIRDGFTLRRPGFGLMMAKGQQPIGEWQYRLQMGITAALSRCPIPIPGD